jgi:prophage tail gpP-like protein
MSGILDALKALLPTPDPLNEVSILIGESVTSLIGWEGISITCSAEAFPRSFTVTASDPSAGDPSKGLSFPSGPGVTCTVYIGKDVVLTGYVDRYTTSISPGQHTITLTGRGRCEDLVDCSADLDNSPGINGSTFSASDLADAASKLCSAFGIPVKCIPEDKGPALVPFTIWLGETPYEVIERVARYAGFLVYEDEHGTVILNRVGKQKMASGFTMPGNIESASCTLSVDQRFSKYTVVWNSVAQFNKLDPILNDRAHAEDTSVRKPRPLIIVSEQYMPGIDLGQMRADWERNRRYGRSQAIHLTCDSWRDSDKKLWQPNYLATIDAPALKITNAEWIIGTVTFRKDNSGTHADLTLMPPDAFLPEPAPLALFDNRIMDPTSGPDTPGTPPTDPKGAASGG